MTAFEGAHNIADMKYSMFPKEPLHQQRRFGSHCGNSYKPQARWCGQWIHRSGDSTSRRDGLTRTVSLLVLLAVKEEVRCRTLKRAGRDFDATEKDEARQTDGGGHEECGTATGDLHRRRPVRRRYRCQVPVLVEVRMEVAEPASSTRPLEGGDESPSKTIQESRPNTSVGRERHV